MCSRRSRFSVTVMRPYARLRLSARPATPRRRRRRRPEVGSGTAAPSACADGTGQRRANAKTGGHAGAGACARRTGQGRRVEDAAPYRNESRLPMEAAFVFVFKKVAFQRDRYATLRAFALEREAGDAEEEEEAGGRLGDGNGLPLVGCIGGDRLERLVVLGILARRAGNFSI